MNDLQRNTEKLNRRSFLKKSGKWSIGLLAASALTGAYSFKAERFWYQIKEIQLKVKNLPKAFDGWRIVQFSDTHLGFYYDIEDFKPVIKKINRLKPDLIFFTGDLIQAGNMVPERYISYLQELKAAHGKWAVIGNHDMSIKNRIIQVLQNAEFSVLENKHDVIKVNQDRLYIAGIDDVMYGFPNIRKAVEGLSEQDCVLFLAHEPDIASQIAKYPIKAQFSGHSHGGQVRLPFYGPLIRQKMAIHYVDGLYHIGETKIPLYVNRGIGTTNLPIRFFCRPEITVFQLTT
ncbi:metallophosphoesterase [Bacillus sp. JJ1764]|uniref:metallophosphoesterase n=1 Tax=Bacillus sp. JJ1764 TaxID=3122964 RepID=UPI002FFE0A23